MVEVVNLDTKLGGYF